MREVKTILVGIDYSEYSREAARYALYLAQHLQASVIFLHVYEQASYISSGLGPYHFAQVKDYLAHQKDIERESQEAIRRFVGEFEQAGVPTEYLSVSGNAPTEIIRIAKEKDTELIVLGTHGRAGISHLLIGSVAEKVVRKSPCPVLTVKLTGQSLVFSV